mmetsp:Transcript_29926/g.75290  ORF Transcript_29926/g.75290 Transcript_29926/m.75290 type:complete len:274 (-) Transcript_29926:33-854(-)
MAVLAVMNHLAALVIAARRLSHTICRQLTTTLRSLRVCSAMSSLVAGVVVVVVAVVVAMLMMLLWVVVMLPAVELIVNRSVLYAVVDALHLFLLLLLLFLPVLASVLSSGEFTKLPERVSSASVQFLLDLSQIVVETRVDRLHLGTGDSHRTLPCGRDRLRDVAVVGVQQRGGERRGGRGSSLRSVRLGNNRVGECGRELRRRYRKKRWHSCRGGCRARGCRRGMRGALLELPLGASHQLALGLQRPLQCISTLLQCQRVVGVTAVVGRNVVS